VPVLVHLLRAGRPGDWGAAEQRWTAAELLRDIGPPAGADAAKVLVAALDDPDAHVRDTAFKALEAIGPAAPEVVPALTERLKSADARAAARALANCGPAGLAAVPALVELLHHADDAVRWNTAWTLGKLRATDAIAPLVAAMKDEAAVEPLTAVLKDPKANVRRDAARSLGQIGPAARPAVPALRALANDPDEGVRAAAKKSLGILGETVN
jgi:HEAT repeat protein